MLLCWKEDPDNRPHFENLADMLGSYTHNEERYERPLSISDSYIDINDCDFSSSDNSESDTTFEQTLVTNSSPPSPCSSFRRSNTEVRTTQNIGEYGVTNANTSRIEVRTTQSIGEYGVT